VNRFKIVVLVGALVGAVLATGGEPAHASGQGPDAYGGEIRLSPAFGSPGTALTVLGRHFLRSCGLECYGQWVDLQFTDAAGTTTIWPGPQVWEHSGQFSAAEVIPLSAVVGPGAVEATEVTCIHGIGCHPGISAARTFTVTGNRSPAATSTDVRVNNPFPGPFWTNWQAEPVIAQNPTNPLNIVVSAQDFSGLPPCSDTTPSVCDFFGNGSVTSVGFYASFDGGVTFPCQGLVDFGTDLAGGDTWVTFDSRGNAYIAAFGGALQPPPPGFHYGFIASVYVAKSTDGGCTWPTASKASGDAALAIAQDKESVTADSSPTSPFRDNVYAAWTKYGGNGFGGAGDQIVFARSTDGGTTWSTPKGISPSDGKPTGFNRTGAVIQVGPNGTVYVLWYDQVQKIPVIRLAISYDGGKTFPMKNLTVASATGEHVFGDPLPGATFVAADLPSFSVGANGTLAVGWSRRTAGHSVVMTSTSTNGLAWSTPVAAVDIPGRSSFFQTAAVDPNGKVNVLVNALDDVPVGTPPGAGVVHYGAYWAQSVDGGVTFGTPLEVSWVESDPDASGWLDLSHQFIGDFISAVADGSHMYGVWTDARNGATCAAEDAFVLGNGPGPDIITQCPVNWGNTDVYLATVSY
jgi:hypothetical protein